MKLTTRIFGIIAGVVLLYVLSTGPVTACYSWAYKKDRIEWDRDNFKKADRAQTFYDKVTPLYEPLSRLTYRSRIFGKALAWYQCLWSPINDQIVF